MSSFAPARSIREARRGRRPGTRVCPKVQPGAPFRLHLVPLRHVALRASLRWMIADVDASLRSLLRATALHGSDVDVVFDSPTQQWHDHVSGSVVNAHLWEIREDVSRRQNDWEDVRNDEGRVVGRRPPLHRYRLRYLVTAWAANVADEHRLLSSLLTALADEQAIPAEHISGDLLDEGLPVFLTIALPSPGEDAPSDLWTGLGIAPRPALDLVVTAPLPRPVPATVATPVRERRITVAAPNGAAEVVPTSIADERRREALAPAGASGPAVTHTTRRKG